MIKKYKKKSQKIKTSSILSFFSLITVSSCKARGP